jgi:2-haloacid dehalogenase
MSDLEPETSSGPSGRTRDVPTTVIFDLGAVVLEWAPHLPFEQVLPPDEVPDFMTKIGFWDWNKTNDGGRPFEVGERELIEQFPDSAVAIRAYREHFPHALTGMVPGTGAIIAELQQAGVRLLALTNWSAETFPHARAKFGLLDRFEAIVVSGTELLAKPDPAIFELIFSRYDVDPTGCVFVDDSPPNVVAAAGLGLTALHFTDAIRLRDDLSQLGLLSDRQPVTEPLFHLTQRDVWAAAQQAGEFPWSTRDLSYERQGYVHCSFRSQVDGVRGYVYADVDDADLVLLELDPGQVDVPIIVEDLGAGKAFPHLYGALPLAAVVRVLDLPLP